MPEDEQTDVQKLEAESVAAYEALKRGKRLEKQRRVLRPQLVKREAVLERKLQPLELELKRVVKALQDIDDGILTGYRLRKPRKPKAEKGD